MYERDEEEYEYEGAKKDHFSTAVNTVIILRPKFRAFFCNIEDSSRFYDLIRPFCNEAMECKFFKPF